MHHIHAYTVNPQHSRRYSGARGAVRPVREQEDRQDLACL